MNYTDAVTRIKNSNEPFEWIPVPRNKKPVYFHQGLYRALLRAGLFVNVITATRKKRFFMLVDRRKGVREL